MMNTCYKTLLLNTKIKKTSHIKEDFAIFKTNLLANTTKICYLNTLYITHRVIFHTKNVSELNKSRKFVSIITRENEESNTIHLYIVALNKF